MRRQKIFITVILTLTPLSAHAAQTQAAANHGRPNILFIAVDDLRPELGFYSADHIHSPHLPFTAPKKYWDLYDVNAISLPASYRQPESTPKEAFHRYGELRNYRTVPKQGHLPEAMAKTLIQGYYACVSYVDAQIGRVLQSLDDLGLADNTIVILWGDHGWNLGDHMLWCKHCTFETSLRTPLVIKVPGMPRGQRSDAITEFIDIYPIGYDAN